MRVMASSLASWTAESGPKIRAFRTAMRSGKLVYQQIPGWHGKCTPGEVQRSNCNQKLIAAQWYGVG